MPVLEKLLEMLCGRVHFYITVGKKPALEITLEKKTIVVEVKSIILAMEFGLHEYFKMRKGAGKGGIESSGIIKTIHDMGYKVKIKYKGMEFDI